VRPSPAALVLLHERLHVGHRSIARAIPSGLDLTVEFTIGAAGRPTSVSLVSPTDLDKSVWAGMQAALSACTFSSRLAGHAASWRERGWDLQRLRKPMGQPPPSKGAPSPFRAR